jgi:ribosomal protein S18 acetylase RimI-like enzyme
MAIGEIMFNVDYNEINIGWLTIFSDRRKGYGTKMMAEFEKYVTRGVPMVRSIVLIPKDFNGTDKNYLCSFYEKIGYTQERIGHPAYSKHICKFRLV